MKNLATTLAKKRTSLDLPPDLLERTDEAVRLGVARSRNSLIEVALEGYLDTIDRGATIDARFAEMSGDTRYREQQLALVGNFADSDSEALGTGLGDRDGKLAEVHADALTLETAGP